MRIKINFFVLLASMFGGATSLWFGFYQDANINSDTAGSNLYVADDINKVPAAAAKQMKSMVNVIGVFITGEVGTESFRLRPDWQDSWNSFAGTVQPMLDDGSVIGFFLGDELVHRKISLHEGY